MCPPPLRVRKRFVDRDHFVDCRSERLADGVKDFPELDCRGQPSGFVLGKEYHEVIREFFPVGVSEVAGRLRYVVGSGEVERREDGEVVGYGAT